MDGTEERDPRLNAPDRLPEKVKEVWDEIVATNDIAGTVDRQALEAYCFLVSRLREAESRIDEEGMVVRDSRGKVQAHPALEVARKLNEQVRTWGDRFAPLVRPTRKRGYMADATAAAIANSPHLQGDAGKKYTGLIAAARTQAWMIDEAQRDSMEALNDAVVKILPQYVKTCSELQITPAALSAGAAPKPPKQDKGVSGGSNVSSFQERANKRRQAG
ncbi:phage terminase small subunit P27 family [Glutamicibacter soli]|uniref:phage terminase small subunit P27 family n=1 Tax=Glutamicibacter soli TaxID=453836 RepID=UPI003FD21E3E